MKRSVINPIGWKCTLRECPPGLFTYNGELGFKSVHPGMICVRDTPGDRLWQVNNGSIDAYYAAGGSHFNEDDMTEVQPCEYVWEEYD